MLRWRRKNSGLERASSQARAICCLIASSRQRFGVGRRMEFGRTSKGWTVEMYSSPMETQLQGWAGHRTLSYGLCMSGGELAGPVGDPARVARRFRERSGWPWLDWRLRGQE